MAARASDASAPLSTYERDFFDRNQQKDIRQADYVQRGNELLTVRGLYMQDRMVTLDKMIRDGRRDDAVAELKKDYCIESESGDDCIERFRKDAALEANRVRGAILRNNKTQRDLSGAIDAKYVDHAIRPQDQNLIQQAPPKKKKRGYVLPTYEQLVAEHEKEQMKMDRLSTQDYDEWVSEYKPREPQTEDFIVYEEVPRDPSDPTSDKVLVPATSQCPATVKSCNCSGGFCYDSAAFKDAKSEYATHVERYRKLEKEVRQDFIRKEEARNREPAARKSPASDQQKKSYESSVGATYKALKDAQVNLYLQDYRSPASQSKGAQGLSPTRAAGALTSPGQDVQVDLKQSKELMDSMERDSSNFMRGKELSP